MNKKDNGAPPGYLYDEIDKPIIMSHRWIDNGNGYLVNRDKGKKVYLHRIILQAKKGQICDHINRNRNDNRRCNLRIVDIGTSVHNRNTINKINTIGVEPSSNGKTFCARIRRNGIRYYLGNFRTIKEAQKIYKIREKELYG